MKSCPKAHCTYPICDCVTDENVPLLRTDQPAPTPILEIGPVFNVAVSHSGCNYLAQEDSVCDKCGRYIKPYRQLERELSAAKAETERLRKALETAAKELGVPQPGYPAPVANAAEIIRAALAATRKEEGNG